MADTKITDLTAITGANTASGDLIPIVDVSDTSMAASGTTKKITRDELELALTADGLTMPAVVSPVTPSADTGLLFAHDTGGRVMGYFVGPSGVEYAFQPHVGRNRRREWQPICGSTTVLVVGCTVPTATGTATSATRSTTNLHQFMERIDYLVTAAATNAVAGFRGTNATATGMAVHMGNVANVGGFHFICRWGPATGVSTSTTRGFCGLTSATGAPTDVQPSSLTNMFGMGWDAADTNIQFMTNDGSGTATKTDLGASFAVPTVDRTSVYELAMFCPPNSTTLKYTVSDLVSGAEASGTVTTDLPAVNTVLTPRGWASVGGTSSVIGVALMSLYIETDF